MKQRFLYYMVVRYCLNGQTRDKVHTELEVAPIIYETSNSYYVAKKELTHEEFRKNYPINQCEECYRISKKTMTANIDNSNRAFRKYYTNIIEPIDIFYQSMYARRIGEELKNSKDVKLLRKVAKELNIENITELKYSDAIVEQIKKEQEK